MVLTKQTDVLLSRRACVETTAVARFFTTECEISGRVVTVLNITVNILYIFYVSFHFLFSFAAE